MQFVLEESSWAWDGSECAVYGERIEQLLDRLDVAHERGEPYAASHELLNQQIYQGLSLCDLLWSHDSPLSLSHEIREHITAIFGRLRYWDDEREWPGIDVFIEDKRSLSPSGALAHQQVSQGLATACLPLPGVWKGRCRVVVEAREVFVHFVVDEPTHRAFFRDTLKESATHERTLRDLAPHAFPNLYFLEDVWDGLRHFEGGYARVREKLQRLLTILDDHGAWAFTDTSTRLSEDEPKTEAERESAKTSVGVPNGIIERRFRRWGLEMAPENPDVSKDGECRRARERMLKDKTLYCEWHYKFERHVNRAHIHPPVPESDGKLIVAIFRDHLKLPGD